MQILYRFYWVLIRVNESKLMIQSDVVTDYLSNDNYDSYRDKESN